MKACTQCDTQLPDESRFCPRCGTPVPGLETDELLASSASDPTGLLDRLRDALADEFRVLREMGRGGMGRVFLAQELALDRRVALKVLPPIFSEHREIVERFKREARTAGKLSHPHIVAVYQVSEREGLTFFTMPFVSGPSLRQVLRRNATPEFGQVRRYLREAADALGYAHAQGVIHRDVKPENMLLEGSERGRLLLTDFGIAKALGAKTTLTRPGEMMGTPYYMSPEQCEELGEIDGRSDQYSLGLVGYEMLAGKFPFSADSMAAIVYKHLHEDPEPLARVRPDAPEDLRRVIMRATRKDPGDRFPTMQDFLDALEPSIVSMAAVTSPPVTAGHSTRRSRGRRRLRLVATVLLLAGGAAALALWQRQGVESDSDPARGELAVLPGSQERDRRVRREPDPRTEAADDAVAAGRSLTETGEPEGPESGDPRGGPEPVNRAGERAARDAGAPASRNSASEEPADEGERDAVQPDRGRASPETSSTEPRGAEAEGPEAAVTARREAEEARRRALAAGADRLMAEEYREASELATAGLGALGMGQSRRALENFRTARDRFDELARRARAASATADSGSRARLTGEQVEADTGAVEIDPADDTPARPMEEAGAPSRAAVPEEAIEMLLERYRRALEAEDRQALRQIYTGSIPEEDARNFYDVWFGNAEDLRVTLQLQELGVEGTTAVAVVRQTMDYRLVPTRERRSWAADLQFHMQADSAGWRLVRVERK